MKLPFGPFVRAMGGIRIDRSVKQAGQSATSMVQLMSDLFKTHPKLVMLVTPEGHGANKNSGKLVLSYLQPPAGVPIALAIWIMLRKNRCRKIDYPTEIMKKIWLKLCLFYAEINASFQKFSVDQRYVNTK